MEQELKSAVAYYFNIEEEKLMGHIRKEKYILPRHIMMYILRVNYEQSFPEIARIFNRHHTSIMFAVKEVQNRMLTSSIVRKAVKDLTETRHLLGVPRSIQDEIDNEFSEALDSQSILRTIAYYR